RQQHLGLGAAFGGEEVAAVDHRRRQRAMVEQRSGARAPCRSGVNLEAFRGPIAEELHAVAALDERDALGRETLEFDRSHLRAVLLALTLLLRLLVVVEL